MNNPNTRENRVELIVVFVCVFLAAASLAVVIAGLKYPAFSERNAGLVIASLFLACVTMLIGSVIAFINIARKLASHQRPRNEEKITSSGGHLRGMLAEHEHASDSTRYVS